MKLTIGFSPCPNDTFIFDALVNNKIDTEGLEFEVILDDVQSLNNRAIEEKLDISKISYGVLPLVLEKYWVLNSGGALGKGVGPLLIAKEQIGNTVEEIEQKVIAIPGENTTAHMLFSLAYPQAMHKMFMVFSSIEEAVINNRVDAGVIIHENRFTYQQKGLKKIIDLGTYWETQTQSPVPLGGIVMKRSFDTAIVNKVDKVIKQSLAYAFAHYPFISDYVKSHSQEMNTTVMKQHIDLYVNDFSLSLGAEGKNAVYTLLKVYNQLNKVNTAYKNVFID
jgi:1,4-dihydroxy-6-naphthoate synthase